MTAAGQPRSLEGNQKVVNSERSRIGDGQAVRSRISFRIGQAALVVGLGTVLFGIAMHDPGTGAAVTIGLGGLIAVIAAWSLLAVDPTYDFLTLAITGLALLLSPWVVGFVGDNAAVTAWVAGALATALGVRGLRGESPNVATPTVTNTEGEIHV